MAEWAWWSYPLLLGVGTLVGFINVMAGGGSALSLPALLFLGVDGATANGTNRVALLIESVAGVRGYHDQQQSAFRESLQLGLLTLPGAILGALLAVRLDNETFKLLLSVVMIGVVISMLIPLHKPDPDAAVSPQRKRWGQVGMFAIGFYGGFIQVGVGFLLMAVLFHGFRETLVRVNMHKVFVVMIYTVPALLVFIWNDHVDWGLGIALGLGNAAGAYLAAHLSVRQGEDIVRKVMLCAITGIALKMLWDLI